MKKVMQNFGALIAEEEGATAIEYGLMAALIAAVVISVVTALGSKVFGLFNTTNKGW